VLLNSADFIASELITRNELPPLLSAAKEEGAVILPVIVSPCRFISIPTLSEFQAVNDPTRPLLSMTKLKQEEIFVKLTDLIEATLRP